MLVSLAFFTISVLFFFFSYLWTDPAIIQMMGQTKPEFLKILPYIRFGDIYRAQFAYLYLFLSLILFFLQLYFLKKSPKLLLTKKTGLIIFLAILIFSFSYPFLSRDIFNYLINAKILWFYHQNPYLVSPSQFNFDQWLFFNHNIDNKYNYPPTPLLYSLIPMVIFSGERFLLNFLGLKFLNALIFFLSGVALYKLSSQKKLIFSLWFFNPFLIIELLINAHNDLLMICLFIFSVYFFKNRKYLPGLVAFLASILTKYFSLAGILALGILAFKPRWAEACFKLLSVFTFLVLFLIGNNPWYLSWVFMFLPFIKLKNLSWVLIYLVGLLTLARYFFFIYYGFWNEQFILTLFKPLIFIIFIFVILVEVNKFSIRSFTKSYQKFLS